MLSSVLKTVRRERLLASGDRVLVAVSGGPDSMALLSVLWELAPRLELRLEVATIDHGLRAGAQAEATLVAERAAALGLPWHRLTVDVAGARRERRGTSLQDAARTVRLQALEALAARLGASRVALGHQQDDQAETVLYRVLRGTGLHGLQGIPYRRGVFVRPLLDVSRPQILNYLRRRSIAVAQDPSNQDSRFARARLRHQVLPLLRQENPRVALALVALAADARRSLAANPPAASAAEGEVSGRAGRAARAAIEALRVRGGSGSVDVSGGRIEVVYGRANFIAGARPARGQASGRDPIAPVSIEGPGMYRLGGDSSQLRQIGIDIKEGIAAPAASAGRAVFDADGLAWPLVLRPTRPGDRMRPRGGRGSRKLSDLLIDQKVPRADRTRLPVLTGADDTILFVPGLRPSEAGRTGAETRRWVSVQVSLGQGGSSV